MQLSTTPAQTTKAPRTAFEVRSPTPAPALRGLTGGLLVAGRYRVERRIGAGAMGEVWLGEHVAIESPVALKQLSTELVGDREQVLRFRREAQLLGRIRSDCVARALDLVEDPELGLVLVLEFVDGIRLSDAVGRGKLTIEEAIDLGLDLATALCHLHAAQVVHRDLKPSNVLLEAAPGGRQRAVLVDFGASRMVSSGDDEADDTLTGITRADMAIGTIEYMAPEQILSARDVTFASDLYALGAILFRVVAGRHVYGALSEGKLVHAKLTQDAAPLVTGRTDTVAQGFEALVTRAVRRMPYDRWPSAEAMVVELNKLRDLARVPPPVPSRPTTAAPASRPSVGEEATTDGAAPFDLVPKAAFSEVSPDELLPGPSTPGYAAPLALGSFDAPGAVALAAEASPASLAPTLRAGASDAPPSRGRALLAVAAGLFATLAVASAVLAALGRLGV